MEIDTHVLEKIKKITEKYNFDKKILVAYSGGKDSFFTCIALRELGYKINPVILDIGVDNNWSIQIDNLKNYGIVAEVINEERLSKFCDWNSSYEIKAYLEMTKENIRKGLTPCTPCYNAKMLMLQFIALKKGIRDCAFGHHGTDAVTSLLKSYFMYVDCLIRKKQEFNIQIFQNLVLEYYDQFTMSTEKFKHSLLYKDIETMIKLGYAGTDEPIRQKCGNIRVVRPLFRVLENEIIQTLNSTPLFFPKAECFRSGYRINTRMTPREFIQQRLLLDRNINLEIIQILLKLIEDNLNADGTMKYDVRRNRTKILGGSYEKTLQSCNKI